MAKRKRTKGKTIVNKLLRRIL